MKTSHIASLFLLSATIFVGGCALTQKSNPVLIPTVSSTGESIENVTASSTVDEVDTSAWKTYRNEEMGFEIKVPAEWEAGTGLLENPFSNGSPWYQYPREGTGSWGNDQVDIRFFAKSSNETLREFVDRNVDEYFSGAEKEMLISGYPVFRELEPIHRITTSHTNVDEYQFRDSVLFKNNDVFYALIVRGKSSSVETAESDFEKWKMVLSMVRLSPVSSSMKETVNEVNGPLSATREVIPSINTSPECKRIESEFTGSIFASSSGALRRMEKYPISKKYEYLGTSPMEDGSYGYEDESYRSILARAFTASDCDQDQVERFFGQRMTGLLPLTIIFSSRISLEDYSSFIRERNFQCAPSENDFSGCTFSDQATIQDLVDLKQYASFIESVMEID